MASTKIKDLEKCKESVKDICEKYHMNVLDISAKEIEPHDIYKEKQYVIDVTTDCDDDLTYDKVLTYCGFLNEERIPNADLTVNLNEI